MSLHDIGEPLYNNEIIEYILYAKQNKIGTIISTSLSIKKSDDFWERFIKSGIDRIIVAIDGITENVYNKYRTNGELNLVLSNLKKLIHFNEVNNSGVIIEWQMIDLPWNRLEQQKAKNMALSMGCNTFNIIPEEVISRKKYFEERKERKRNCLLPYIILVINAQNKVRPCCNLYKGLFDDIRYDNIIGDLSINTIQDIWNCKEMITIRNRKLINNREYCSLCQEM